MTASQTMDFIRKLRWRYVIRRSAEALLAGLTAMFLVLTTSALFRLPEIVSFALAATVALIVAAVWIVALRLHAIGDPSVTRYLNRHYPDLGESADLLIRNDNTFSTLEQLQKELVTDKLDSLRIRLPHRLVPVVIFFGLSLAYFMTVRSFSFLKMPSGISSSQEKTEGTAKGDGPAALTGMTISIVAPAYTGLPTATATGDLVVPEGSTARWSATFSKPVTSRIIFSGKDTVAFSHMTARVVTEPGFYQLQWKSDGQPWRSGDFYKMEMIRDQAPKIVVENLPAFTEFHFDEKLAVEVETLLTDDYGLSAARIVATVSKGTGESVKFREEKLAFDRPAKIQGKSVSAKRYIDLRALGMEPGDELYFYLEADDNRTPIANRSRTETFFVTVRDTASESVVADAGMAVDLMPEYFRSQRQIIIDSEKLLAEQKRKKVTPADFNDRSNSLGYDERVLRLRYSQFMGEEVEASEANETQEQANDAKPEDIAREYGHSHDTENEVNQVPEKSRDPLEQSIRAKLRAAVNMMWDAELHLRLNDPAKSLPFQYKILKLLKEIANDSRTYVKRSGFDPPPLKEDKRLGGDLADLKTTLALPGLASAQAYPNLRRALQMIGNMLAGDTIVLTLANQQLLRQAGQELAGVVTEEPTYLHSLSLVNALTQQEIETSKMRNALRELQTTFWKIVPTEIVSPSRHARSLHSLDQTFIKQLGAGNHD